MGAGGSESIVGVLDVDALVVIPYVRGMLWPGVLETAQETAPEGVTVRAVEVDHPHDTTDDIWRFVNGEKFPVGNDGTGYHTLIEQMWSMKRTFVVIEQDVLVQRDTISTLLSCRRPWCGCHYQIGGALDTSVMLGCTKFSASMQRLHPKMMERVGEFGCEQYGKAPFSHANCANPTGVEHDGVVPRSWVRLDTRISTVLMQELHYKPHRHGLVEHLHDYTHNAGCKCYRCLAIPPAVKMDDPTAFNILEVFR